MSWVRGLITTQPAILLWSLRTALSASPYRREPSARMYRSLGCSGHGLWEADQVIEVALSCPLLQSFNYPEGFFCGLNLEALGRALGL